MLHQLGDRRIALDSDSAIATRRSDGSLVFALWNYAPPDGTGANYTPPPATRGPSKTVTLQLAGIAPNATATILRLDEDHGNVIKTYDAMGRPAFPSRNQIVKLRQAGSAAPPEKPSLKAGKLTLDIPPQGLVLVTINSKAAN
jgi:xylan 1,4-beta-xylosidase